MVDEKKNEFIRLRNFQMARVGSWPVWGPKMLGPPTLHQWSTEGTDPLKGLFSWGGMVRPLTDEESCHAVLHETSVLSPPRMHQGSAGVADPYNFSIDLKQFHTSFHFLFICHWVIHSARRWQISWIKTTQQFT